MYEEEKIAREDLARLCHKAENDANFWRLKYEQDGVAKIEELEYTKLKLQARFVQKIFEFWLIFPPKIILSNYFQIG